jgi:hypothetical protein
MTSEVLLPAERDDRLKSAAAEIHAGLERWWQGQQSAAEGMLRAAAALAAAKELFHSTRAFGEWCQTSGFGASALNANDRAALIAFGADLDKAKQILAVTERKSPQHIYANEWNPGRLTHVRKSAKSKLPQSFRRKSAPPCPADEIADLVQVILKRLAGGPALTARQIADRVNAPFSNTVKALERLGPQAELTGDTYRIFDPPELPAQAADNAEIASLKKQLGEKDREIARLTKENALLKAALLQFQGAGAA